MFSLQCLARPVSDRRGCEEEGLRFAKAFMDTLQVVDPDDRYDQLVGARDSLAYAYNSVGLHMNALEVTQSIYDLRLAQYGPTHVATIKAVVNLSCDLENCGFELKRRTLLRDAYGKARRALGETHMATDHIRFNLADSLFRRGADAPREDILEAAALMRLCVEQRSQANGPDHPSTRNVRHFEERVLDALESERPAKRARTLRLRDDDTRWDHQEEEARRAAKRSWATTRAAARNEERRRHFSAVTTLKQIRLRMQEHREEQQRPRSRCVVS